MIDKRAIGIMARLLALLLAAMATAAASQDSSWDLMWKPVQRPTTDIVDAIMNRQARRIPKQCAEVIDFINKWRSEAGTSGKPPVFHWIPGEDGEGAGVILNERVAAFMVAVVLRRPLIYLKNKKFFDWPRYMGSTVLDAADSPVTFMDDTRFPPSINMTKRECMRLERSKANKDLVLGYRCWDVGTGSSSTNHDYWHRRNERNTAVLGVDDDASHNYFDDNNPLWHRWSHWANASLVDPMRNLFPKTAFGYISHTFLLVFVGDFLRVDPRFATLTKGANEHQAPHCLTAIVADRPADAVLGLAKQALAPLPEDALLMTLHVRLGDSAMGRENTNIVDMDQEDTKGTDRIKQKPLERRLQCTAENLALLRKRAHPRKVGIFVASDTKSGLSSAKRYFPDALTIRGLSVHTSRIQGKAEEVSAKIVSDFFALSLGDVVVSIGSSTFGAMAAAKGLAAVSRVGGADACGLLNEDEIATILKNAGGGQQQ